MQKINETLQRLGITPNYRGYAELRLALQLVQEDPERLTALVRRVYAEIGRATGQKWTTVERHLRYTILRAWEINPEYMREIAGRPLCQKPETGEFLAMVYVYLEGDVVSRLM